MTEIMSGVNPYNYCFNNPINCIDPNGMEATIGPHGGAYYEGQEAQDQFRRMHPESNTTNTPDYKLPSSPKDIDINVWEPYKPDNVPEGKGHTQYWKNKNSKLVLAWDEDGHYHLYSNERFKYRLSAQGNLLKNKGSAEAHLKPGVTIRMSNALRTSLMAVTYTFDIFAIFTDSPQNPIYIFQPLGSGEQNRAYIDVQTSQIFEWSIVPNSNVREVRFYQDYDYIKGEWRGVGLLFKQYFAPTGHQVPSPSVGES